MQVKPWPRLSIFLFSVRIEVERYAYRIIMLPILCGSATLRAMAHTNDPAPRRVPPTKLSMNTNKTTKQPIQLSDHFTYRKLLQFTAPSIMMMIFTSIYGVVDGFFVSNYAGSVAFAGLNLVMPFIMVLSAIGFMFGTGGTALVSMTYGMGDRKRANEIFSLVVYVLIAIGLILAIIGFVAAPAVTDLLGATPEMRPYGILYIRINMAGQVQFMLQNLFQSFLVTAERPKLGLYVTLAAGFTNMILDWLFVAVFGWGLAGAAWATVISQTVGGIIPLIYFLRPNSTFLRLGKTHWMGDMILKAATNGSSEFLSNASSSFIGILYNYQLLAYAGSNGVAAYGVIMYVNFIFVGIYFGYSVGVAPVIGYHYGAGHHDELHGLLTRSLRMIGIAACSLTLIAQLAANLLASIFVSYDAELMALTVHGFRIYAIAFLFMGFNIFGSGFFTALNNGLISAVLSFARSLVLQLIAVYLMPFLFGMDGLWAVVLTADSVCILLTITMWVKNRKRYNY